MLSLYVLSRYRGLIQFTFIFSNVLQDRKFRETFKNTCKDDENRLGKIQAECRQKQVVVLGIKWSLHVLCQEGIKHPMQLYGKIMEASWTSSNGFLCACATESFSRRLPMPRTQDLLCPCTMFLLYLCCSSRNGVMGRRNCSQRKRNQRHRAVNRELNHRLVSTIHHVVLHSWLTTAEREWFPGLHSAKLSWCQYYTICILFGAETCSSYTSFSFSFSWTWI